MTEAAEVKAPAPLRERMAALEAEPAQEKECLDLLQAAFQRSGQTAQAAAKGRREAKEGRATRP
ncbi:MAG: hypothetical protein ACUVQQ_13130 [Thermogutta sp.]